MNNEHKRLANLLDIYEKYLVISTQAIDGKVIINERLIESAPIEAVRAFEEKETILSSEKYEPIR